DGTCDLWAVDTLGGGAEPGDQCVQSLQDVGRDRSGRPAHGAAFTAEAGGGHTPSLTDVADAVGVGYTDLVEEDFVERGAAGHLANGAHRHPGCVHVDHEHGQPGVLGGLRVRPYECFSDVGQVGHGGPHFLSGQDPVVPVAYRAGGDPGKVGAGPRFGEQLASDRVTAVERWEYPLP